MNAVLEGAFLCYNFKVNYSVTLWGHGCALKCCIIQCDLCYELTS